MSISPSRRRLHRLPALFLGLTLALSPLNALALPRDLTPGVAAPSPLEKEGNPAQAYEAAQAALTDLGFGPEQIRILWARLGEQLVPRLEAGQLSRWELDLLALPYCYEDRLDRYLAYSRTIPELTLPDVVTAVNMGLDQDFYANIEELTDPASPTALVNKFHALPADYVPELVELDPVYGSGSLTPEAALAFARMVDAARMDDVFLHSVSAYRSYATQSSVYRRNVSQSGQYWADTFSARPGHSEHQTGLALDVNVARTSAHFENTPEFAWLQENCARFGFILRYPADKTSITGYRFEPWHYRYVGEEIARLCTEEGLTYEEYIARLPVSLDNQVPALTLDGAALEADGLMLEGTPYLSARELAAQLGWSSAREGTLLVLTKEEHTLAFHPGRSCLWDEVFHRLSAPAVELDGDLYLPLSDLCAALGLELVPSGQGMELVEHTQPGF